MSALHLQIPGADGVGTIEIPAKYEVCGRCEGSGSHTNPAVDGHGITADEMYELGDDFREDYLSGVYDVRCEECRGERVVLVVDEARATTEQLAIYRDNERQEWEYRMEIEAERRMGA